MTRRIAWMLAVALLGIAAPAHATDDSQSFGRCEFQTVSQENVTGTDTYKGAAHAQVLVYSDSAVVSATVTCEIRLNDVVAATASGSGSGVVVVAGQVSYTSTDFDDVDICTIVDFTSDDTPTTTTCFDIPVTQVPPHPPHNTIELVLELLGPYLDLVFGYVDPAVCAAFQDQAPGAPPTVVIDDEGDVYLDGSLFWDCPPYEEALS